MGRYQVPGIPGVGQVRADKSYLGRIALRRLSRLRKGNGAVKMVLRKAVGQTTVGYRYTPNEKLEKARYPGTGRSDRVGSGSNRFLDLENLFEDTPHAYCSIKTGGAAPTLKQP